MKTVCTINKCTGCMACLDLCRKNAITIKDDLMHYNAIIDQDKCIGCNICHNICQNNSESIFHSQIAWYQGWIKDKKLRMESSSGGAAIALARAVIAKEGCVFSCVFSNGNFHFKCAENYSDIKRFTGSKYVKSNPAGVYRQIQEKLKNNKMVLFIGLPCQVSALKKVVGDNDLLITVDLICHGSPSPKLLEQFLNQYGCNLSEISDISFRVKDRSKLTVKNKMFTPKGIRDRYLIAFLNGLIYTDNCYDCKYARTERVSDITIGDSWGSKLPEEEQIKGISLLLVQTEKGHQLLKNAEMELKNVDLKKAIVANHQLVHPPIIPDTREMFFRKLAEGNKFNSLIKKCYPVQCFRQDLKAILVKIGFKREVALDYRITITKNKDYPNQSYEV
jgi:coenzyme F420-reducing hydrogenase beta subunit